MERRIFWMGTSLVDLKKFPAKVIQKAGYQLHLQDIDIAKTRYQAIIAARVKR